MFSPSSILLIKLRHHGDVLLATPVARVLKERFPHCQIDLLVYEGTEPLVRNNTDFTHIWSWDKTTQGWLKNWKYLKLFVALRKQRYDWVLHLSDQMQGALLARLLAHHSSVGIDYPRRRNFFWRACFTHLIPLFASNTQHTVEQNLETLKPLGIEVKEKEARCRLDLIQEDQHVVQQYLQEAAITKPYIVIHPAARWFFKCWEDDRFAEVISYLREQGWPVVITSSPSVQERSLVTSIVEKIEKTPPLSSADSKKITSMPQPPLLLLAGKLTLGQLAALIEGSCLFIGVDSVPMHMAAALGKEVVALFGPSKVKEWSPWKTEYRLIQAADYGSLLDPDAVDTGTKERYLSNIPVAPVIEAIEALLKNTSPN